MKFLTLFILLLLPLFSKSFSVASYNVENLFDLKYDKTEYEEFIPHKTNWNASILEIKLQNIAQVINELNADIIALQEIESLEALKLLQKKLPQYSYAHFTKNPQSSIGLAILSKYKIIETKSIAIKSNERHERPIQKVIIEIQNQKHITIFNNHWRSKRAKESKRIEYALSLQNYLNTLDEHNDYILIGDFNSNYDEYLTFKHNKNLNDSYNITGINQVLNTTIEQQYVTKESIHNYKQRVHYNLWLELPYHERFSYIYKNSHNTPDNIIVSKGLFDNENISYLNDSFKNFAPNYLFHNKKINRWQIKQKKHKGVGYSDHLPILAQFSTLPYKQQAKNTQSKTTSYLYEIDNLSTPLKLNDLVVLYKKDASAVLKQKNNRAIFAYNCAKELQEGYSYDIEIQKLYTHFGLKEITQLKVLKKYPKKQNVQTHYLNGNSIDLFDLQYQNEIIGNLTGSYKNGYLYFNNTKIKLYAKDKSLLPKNGQNITIMSGHLGFFKSNVQIIIYKQSDFRAN